MFEDVTLGFMLAATDVQLLFVAQLIRQKFYS
jgi:hypothetical protein